MGKYKTFFKFFTEKDHVNRLRFKAEETSNMQIRNMYTMWKATFIHYITFFNYVWTMNFIIRHYKNMNSLDF